MGFRAYQAREEAALGSRSKSLLMFALAAVLLLAAAPSAWACDKCGAKTKSAGKSRRLNDLDLEKWYKGRKKENAYTVKVTDLGCESCVKIVRERLKEIDGVVSVEGDAEKKELRVVVEEGKELDKEAVRKAVEEAGYTYGGTTREGEEDR